MKTGAVERRQRNDRSHFGMGNFAVIPVAQD
jgi:hypothetical protein